MNEKSTLRKVANDYLTHTNKRNGITLVALIITVIVLLILAGVAISTVVGNKGLLSKSKTSVEVYSKEQAKEKLQMYLYDIKMDIIATRDTTAKDCLLLKEKEGIEKIEFISKGSASATIVGGEIADPEYAMVTCFSFTFKVNGKLMIVSGETNIGGNNVEIGTPETPIVPTKYTLSFNSNGGNAISTTYELEAGEVLGLLPTPVRSNTTFLGWYVGDTLYTNESLMPSQNLTLKAKWDILEITKVEWYSDKQFKVTFSKEVRVSREEWHESWSSDTALDSTNLVTSNISCGGLGTSWTTEPIINWGDCYSKAKSASFNFQTRDNHTYYISFKIPSSASGIPEVVYMGTGPMTNNLQTFYVE